MSTPPQPDAENFVLRLVEALHRFGAAAHRLEAAVGGVAQSLGLQGSFFASPTSAMVAFGPLGAQRVHLIRVEPGGVELDRLAQVDSVGQQVADGALTPTAGVVRLEEISRAKDRFGPVTTLLAFGLVSACVARVFGGGGLDMAVSGAIGLCVGLLAIALPARPNESRLLELLGAFVAAALADLATRAWPGVSASVCTLAGLIVLLPGYSLTVAVAEVATRNLMSGTSRLTAAAIVFLQLAFGVALAERLLARVLGPAVATLGDPLPLWTQPLAVLISTAGLIVILRAPVRSALWVVLAAFVAFYGARFGAGLLGPELGAGLGAFLLTTLSNLYARWARKPAVVPLVPGLLLLVPGSTGLRSLESLLHADVLTGVNTAFTMLLIVVSIVAGLLFANAAVPPRRSL